MVNIDSYLEPDLLLKPLGLPSWIKPKSSLERAYLQMKTRQNL